MSEGLQSSSWTPEAAEVLARACEYHGGLATWRALRRIRLYPERLSGLVPSLKGIGRTFPLPPAIDVLPHDRRAEFIGYPDESQVGVFENGAVRLERRDGGGIVASADNHRASFRGWAKYRTWTPLDALYFFGYALTHYHALPFTLAESRLIRSWNAGSARAPISVLEVELPADLPTHSRRQTFFFDEHARLFRHDYHAEIVGTLARGAHFWKRESRVSGFPISLERHVVVRLGTIPLPATALHAIFRGAEVELRAPSSTDAEATSDGYRRD